MEKFRRFRGFGALALLGGLGRHRHQEERFERTNTSFQTYSTDISTSWEDRARTYLEALRGKPVCASEWSSFLARFRNDFGLSIDRHTVFSSDELCKFRRWLEDIRGGQLTDSDFEMLTKDIFKSKSISFNDADLQQISSIRAGGIANNFSSQTQIFIQAPPPQVTNTKVIEEYHHYNGAPTESAQVALQVEQNVTEEQEAATAVQTQETTTTTHTATHESNSSSSASYSEESAASATA